MKGILVFKQILKYHSTKEIETHNYNLRLLLDSIKPTIKILHHKYIPPITTLDRHLISLVQINRETIQWTKNKLGFQIRAGTSWIQAKTTR